MPDFATNSTNEYPADPGQATPIARPTVRFMFANPAHFMALGFGSGLAPIAPGTSGTLWAWLAFIALSPVMNDMASVSYTHLTLPTKRIV